ncbi:MAG: sigma-70 family RNA polymerase sigma factor [Clostridia bacterium]|nr:sigma-70 family RNA polymerase sigma factor [Clostridia bacterium]
MDLETVRKAKQGYVNEIGQLILENMQTLYRVAFSILQAEDEIYDAISSTTVIVFEKIHTLKNEEYFKTWLTRILINECYKIYNQNKKIIHLETYNQEKLTYNDSYIDLEIKNLVKNLDKDLRQIVVLYYFEDFSVKEIAKIVRIPEGTVKSRLSRARKELEKVLIKDYDKERRNSNG